MTTEALEQQIVQALSGQLKSDAILELLERTEAAIEYTARAAEKQ